MNPETVIMRRIMLALSEAGAIVFRNETGQYWTGKTLHRSGNQITLGDARMVPCGLFKGSADLIGIWPPTGQFLAIEVKTAKGRATKEQLHFINTVKSAGGIAGIARSSKDALDLLPR